MCAVVMVVDWRLTDACLWERAADALLTVESSSHARATLRDGSSEVTIPCGEAFDRPLSPWCPLKG